MGFLFQNYGVFCTKSKKKLCILVQATDYVPQYMNKIGSLVVSLALGPHNINDRNKFLLSSYLSLGRHELSSSTQILLKPLNMLLA